MVRNVLFFQRKNVSCTTVLRMLFLYNIDWLKMAELERFGIYLWDNPNLNMIQYRPQLLPFK